MFEVVELKAGGYVRIAVFNTLEEAKGFKKGHMRKSDNPTRIREIATGKEVI